MLFRSLQLSILARLIGCKEDGEFNPRPGSFFGVGDPKQSIYRFRGADVGVFRGILSSFGRPGTRMLSQTFRFHRGLATVVNRLFASVLGHDSFDELEAADATIPDHSAELLISLADKDVSPTVDDRSELEAAMVSRRIARLIENGEAGYGDIVVLMQRHKTGYYFEEAFKRSGIPYCVIGGQRFYQQQEIRDATSALRALRNPGDDLALATVLRSPYFGISDNGLYRLRAAGSSLRRALEQDALLASLDADDTAKALRARQWLTTFSRRAGRIGIARLMEEAFFETGIAHVTLPQFLGLQRYANLRRMMEMAREHDRSGNPRLEDFLATVEQVILEAVEESEAPLSEIGDDAVRLMSIHKAKGLEFRHVFLVNCDYQRSGGAGDCLYAAKGIGLAPLPPDRLKRQKRSGRTIYDAEVARERLEEQDEFRRLFYVAATRAQQRLYVCGSTLRGKSAGGWLRWMWDGLGLSSNGNGDEIEPGEQTIELRDRLGHLTNLHVNVMEVDPLEGRGTATRRTAALETMANGRLDYSKLDALRESASAGRVEKLSRAVGTISAPPEVLRLSVTGLADYVKCPALFRYRHVLRIGDLPWPKDRSVNAEANTNKSAEAAAVGGATLGTLVHAVLAESQAEEISSWLPAAERIIRQSPDVAPAQREATLRSVMDMLKVYQEQTPLSEELRKARKIYRELPFALKSGRAVISGKIDLLYQSHNGQWRIVDFKTDRTLPDQDSLNSSGYAMQMLIYRLACEKFLGVRVENTCLLFIRSGKLLPCQPTYDRVHIDSIVDLILEDRYSSAKSCHAD